MLFRSGGQGPVHDQGDLNVVVQRQGAVANNVNIGLDELPKTPLLGALTAPNLLDLVALEGEVEGACVVQNVAGEGDGQVEVQAKLLTRVGLLCVARIGLEAAQKIDLLGRLPLAGQLAKGLYGAGLNAAETVQFKGAAQGVDKRLLNQTARGESLGEAGEGGKRLSCLCHGWHCVRRQIGRASCRERV